MASDIVVSIITSISAIIVAVIGAVNIRLHQRDAKRADQRATEARLGMEMQVAAVELSDVIAIAVTGGHTNGNVEAARRKALEAKRAYYDYINSIAIDTLTHR